MALHTKKEKSQILAGVYKWTAVPNSPYALIPFQYAAQIGRRGQVGFLRTGNGMSKCLPFNDYMTLIFKNSKKHTANT